MCHVSVRNLILLASLVAAAVPGTAISDDSKIDPSWPDWLKEAMAKEYEDIAFEPLSLGPITTVLPGKITEKQEVQPGRFYASTDDGSGSGFECWFFTDSIDIASSMAAIADVVIETLSEQHGPVGLRNVFHVDAGEIDGSSFLALEWLYTVGEAPETLVGLTKIRAAERNGTHVICAHSLPGYRQSFADGFAQVVRQLNANSEGVDPYYQEIYTLELNGLKTGFARMTMSLDDEGDTRIDTTEAMVVPISSTELATSDSTSVSWSTPDGYLINTVDYSAENGELTMDLTLQLDDEGGWVVDGSFSGKEMNEQLGAEGEPVSALGEILAIRRLLREPDAAPIDLAYWIPDADPAAFTNVTIALDSESGAPGAASITMGPLKIDGEFDDNGSMRHGTMNVGGIAFIMERVYTAGAVR